MFCAKCGQAPPDSARYEGPAGSPIDHMMPDSAPPGPDRPDPVEYVEEVMAWIGTELPRGDYICAKCGGRAYHHPFVPTNGEPCEEPER